MQNNTLPTLQDCPALKYFSHLLCEDGLFEAQDVIIYWNNCAAYRIKDVAICYIPRRYIAEQGYENHPVFKENACVFSKRLLRNSSGNVFRGWMSGEFHSFVLFGGSRTAISIDTHPDEVYAFLCETGFSTYVEKQKAIKQFAHIRECMWAREVGVADERFERFKPQPPYFSGRVNQGDASREGRRFPLVFASESCWRTAHEKSKKARQFKHTHEGEA